jgi:cellulose synthase/poly-beta-1,6-N-acetylglucosamine synthase-like glycosyltransferase
MPPSDKRNKAKAINYMLSGLTEEYDNCIIMDADNHVESNFLAQVNQYFLYGTQILQARR